MIGDVNKMDKELIEEIIQYVEQTAEDFSGEYDMGQSFQQQLEEPNEDGSFRYIPSFYFKLKDMLNQTERKMKNGESS